MGLDDRSSACILATRPVKQQTKNIKLLPCELWPSLSSCCTRYKLLYKGSTASSGWDHTTHSPSSSVTSSINLWSSIPRLRHSPEARGRLQWRGSRSSAPCRAPPRRVADSSAAPARSSASSPPVPMGAAPTISAPYPPPPPPPPLPRCVVSPSSPSLMIEQEDPSPWRPKPYPPHPRPCLVVQIRSD